MPIKELCRTAGSSDSTFFGWRDKLGGMQVSEAQRLLTEAHMDMHALVAACGERWAPLCRGHSHINGLFRNVCSLVAHLKPASHIVRTISHCSFQISRLPTGN